MEVYNCSYSEDATKILNTLLTVLDTCTIELKVNAGKVITTVDDYELL